MGVSVSFHISTGAKTKASLGGADKHNERKYKKHSLDNSNSAINFEYTKFNEVLVGTKELFQDVKKVYKEEFQNSVDEYNEKQKKSSRKIYDYFEKVSDNKRTNLYTEIVIQVGDNDFWKEKNIDERKKMVDVFEKQLELVNEFYPNFKVANATVHLDESSPHMHVIGVCSSNEELLMKNFPNEEKKKRRGLKQYVSQREVFTQTNLKEFHNFFDEKSVELLNERYNLNETLNDKRVKQEYFELELYKKLAPKIKEVEKLNQENEQLKNKLKEENKKFLKIEDIKNNVEERKPSFLNKEHKVILKKEDYDSLLQYAVDGEKFYKEKIKKEKELTNLNKSYTDLKESYSVLSVNYNNLKISESSLGSENITLGYDLKIANMNLERKDKKLKENEIYIDKLEKALPNEKITQIKNEIARESWNSKLTKGFGRGD